MEFLGHNSLPSILSGGAPEITVVPLGIPPDDEKMCGCNPQYVCVVDKHTGLLMAVNPPRAALKSLICAKPPVSNGGNPASGVMDYYDLVKKEFDVKVGTGQKANQLQLKCAPGSPCPSFPMEGWIPSYQAKAEFSLGSCPSCVELATQLGQTYLENRAVDLGEMFEAYADQVNAELNDYVLSHPDYVECVFYNCAKQEIDPKTPYFTPCPENRAMLEGIEPFSREFYTIISSPKWRELEMLCRGSFVTKVDCPECAYLLDMQGNPVEKLAYDSCVAEKCLTVPKMMTAPGYCHSCESFVDRTTGKVADGYYDCYNKYCAPPTGGVVPEGTEDCWSHLVGLVKVKSYGTICNELTQYPVSLDSYIRAQELLPLSAKRTPDAMHFPEWSHLDESDPEAKYYMTITPKQWAGLTPAERAEVYKWADTVVWRKKLEIVESVDLGKIKQFWLEFDVCMGVTPKIPVPPSFKYCHECVDYIDFNTLSFLPAYFECAQNKCPPIVPPCAACAEFYNAQTQTYLPGYFNCFITHCTKKKVCDACSQIAQEYGVNSEQWINCYVANCYDFCPTCRDTGEIFGYTSADYLNCVERNCNPENVCPECQSLYDTLGVMSEEYQRCVVHCTVLKDTPLCVECDRFDKNTQLYEYLACVQEFCHGNTVQDVCRALDMPELTPSAVKELTQRASLDNNLANVSFCDPDLVRNIRHFDSGFKVISAGKLVNVDGVAYLEDSFYYAATDKTVYKRTRVFTGDEIFAYLGDKVKGLTEDQTHALVNETAHQLTKVDYYLKQGAGSSVLTSSGFIQTACAELEQCLKMKLPPPDVVTELNKYWFNAVDKTYNYSDAFRVVKAIKNPDDSFLVEVTDKLLGETKKVTINQVKIAKPGPYQNIAKMDKIADWLIDDLIEHDTTIQDWLKAQDLYGVTPMSRCAVRYGLVPSSSELYGILLYMTQVKMPYTGTNFHKLTGFYTPLEMLTEEVQTTYHQYAVVLKEDKVVKMPEYVKDTYIAHDKHTPVSSIHIETNHGLNVIIPPERIVHVIPEIPLKEVEAHLRSIEGAVHLRSIDYIHSLAIRLAVPKVVFKGVPIDTFIYKESASSIHTALMTLIRSDSFLAESELLKKDVTLEVQIVNDEFIRNSKNPYGEITLEVQIKSESIKEYYEQVYPHLSPELKIQTDTFFDKLTKLSKLTLNEIPIDCFVWREELPDGTTKVTLNVV